MGNLGNLKINCLHSELRKKIARKKFPVSWKSRYPPPPGKNNGPSLKELGMNTTVSPPTLHIFHQLTHLMRF